ncbi:membrane lipoprotein lipid attachment site-containing protein [Myroides phaeus]|uniref:membrane lipoprotein lipid attachment site-containing protein n=1 Tax=Myroides phaeus TaxID=702745 RepID=UPI002DB97386|nr:membrane lipoprotein lipid attachment site-containing protein [Myroides phaeus]MEC4117185.1 membrane lipoprotein lipid attachment site-containing protein [Myroides phaeus]
MKKLVFFLLTAVAVTGCSSDDNASQPTKIEGPEINTVDFSGVKVGDEVALTGKGFRDFDEKDYKILFVERLPQQTKSISSTENTTRALPPTESDRDVVAQILAVKDNKIIFLVPNTAGNGDVKFVYKQTKKTFGYFTR